MVSETAKVLGDGLRISRRRRLRSATTNIAGSLVVVGKAAQLQFDLFDASDEAIDDLIEPLRARGEKPWVDALHLPHQVLHVAGNLVWNFAISAEHLVELREIANSFTKSAFCIGSVQARPAEGLRSDSATALGSFGSFGSVGGSIGSSGWRWLLPAGLLSRLLLALSIPLPALALELFELLSQLLGAS
jgi:hypothetical protein